MKRIHLVVLCLASVAVACTSDNGNGGSGGSGGDASGGSGGAGGKSGGSSGQSGGSGGSSGAGSGGSGGSTAGTGGSIAGTGGAGSGGSSGNSAGSGGTAGALAGSGGTAGMAGAMGGKGGAGGMAGAAGMAGMAGATGGTAGMAANDTGCGSATDNAKFNFEESIQGWGYIRHMTAGRPAPVVSTAQHCNGKSSLEYSVTITGTETGDAANYILGVGATPFGAGNMKKAKRVVFHVWVPATPEINFQPFIGGNAQISGPNSYAVPGGIHRGGWTKFAVDTATLPAGDDSQIWIGLYTTAAFTGKLYIDSVDLEN